MDKIIAPIGLVISAIVAMVSVLGWIENYLSRRDADTKLKTAQSGMQETINQLAIGQSQADARLATIEIQNARSDQERIDIHKAIERLDVTKASKDRVDSVVNEITNLKADMDKRFDRIESLLGQRRSTDSGQ